VDWTFWRRDRWRKGNVNSFPPFAPAIHRLDLRMTYV
jgi:hypothetical protein